MIIWLGRKPLRERIRRKIQSRESALAICTTTTATFISKKTMLRFHNTFPLRRRYCINGSQIRDLFIRFCYSCICCIIHTDADLFSTCYEILLFATRYENCPSANCRHFPAGAITSKKLSCTCFFQSLLLCSSSLFSSLTIGEL